MRHIAIQNGAPVSFLCACWIVHRDPRRRFLTSPHLRRLIRHANCANPIPSFRRRF